MMRLFGFDFFSIGDEYSEEFIQKGREVIYNEVNGVRIQH